MSRNAYERYVDDILDAVQDGVMIVDPDGNISLVNAAMRKLTGFSEEHLVSTTCTVLGCDACELLRNGSRNAWCVLFERQQVLNKRCTITKRDGSYVTVIKNAFVLKDSGGRAIGAVESFSDISDIEQKDLKIQELLRLLEQDVGFHGMVGKSPVMERVYQVIEKAAASDANVLITGESGTGKELVANAIHELGNRRQGPFMKINCAALNESIIESELFGHAKGAFTGAYQHRKGLFEAASGGDIFLDEIGEIPSATQAKLLRVLETKQFVRIGDTRPIYVDLRIITASNRNLMELTSQGRFREDLFYRINVFPIHLPALRERHEDIPLLINAFLNDLQAKYQKRMLGVNPAVMEIFMSYDWPGNVRELKSILEYALLITDSGVVELRHLPPNLQRFGGEEAATTGLGRSAENSLRLELIDALRKAGGNQSQAARILGVHRMTVLNRMRKYGIQLKRDLG